jgi:sugar-phosphatase
MITPADVLLECEAVLFDLDGVLIDSTAAIEALWGRWADGHGLDRAALLATVHGRRARDVIPEAMPDLDPVAELARFEELETGLLEGLRQLPGAAALLAALPRGRWAVVTSGGRRTATARLEAAGLPLPDVLVHADEVDRGKPDPAGYLLGASRLGVPPGRCLVVEDAPAGVAAGRAAGARVLALGTTHPRAELAGADAEAADLSEVTVADLGPPLRLRVGPPAPAA